MVKSAVRRITRTGRKFLPTWRYLFNLAPTVAYLLEPPSLGSEAARVLSSLNRDGVAKTSVEALLGSNSCFDELMRSVQELQTRLSPDIEGARYQSNEPGEIGKKSFLVEYLGNTPSLEPDSIYARFALQKPITDIANAYVGMYTRLRYYNIWHTFSSQSPARESQLWHRDREDPFIVKVFVYLCDIEESAGPFTYAAGSHLKGRVRTEPSYSLEGAVRRSDDSQMANVVPPERWISCAGPKGTIVFADTHGYHKGGLTRRGERVMYTCMFTSPASESREFLRRPSQRFQPATRTVAFALSAPKGGLWVRWWPEN